MHTAARLIETCFRGPLLAGRTVILVTHALDLALPAASFVVRIENGFVFSAGPPATVNRTDLVDEPEGRGAEANGSDDISDQDLEEKNVRMAKLKLVTEETQSRGSSCPPCFSAHRSKRKIRRISLNLYLSVS